jgi:glycosyltransferase involved in cell wall biosynthesis
VKNIKTTVYIVSHNYGKYLEAAIESVLRQTIDDWELIIIDDNSSDNTSAIMNFYKGDRRIRLFTTPGIGLPAVCNFALKESRGKYIIRLDGDDIFEENILLVLSNYLDRNPECSMVFPDYYLIDEFGRIFAHEKREKMYENNHVSDIPANGACCLIRTNILEDVGGYREDLGVQDGYDLWNKLNGKYKIANVNVPLFYYRRHKNNLTNKSHQILSARRKIKQENVINKLDHYRPITAVIPCRQNYDFCPDVWKREIKRKTLLQRSIEKCLKSSIIDYVFIASDNPEVQDVMAIFTDQRLSFYKRNTEETIRSRSLVPTLEKVVTPIDPNWKGLTVIAYIQAPFVTTRTLDDAIYTLILNDADCAFGVEELRSPLYKRTGYGLQPINPRRGFSTDFDTIYRESNTSLATRNRNFTVGSLTGPSVVNFTVSHEEYFFIDSEQKMRISEIMANDK